MLAVLPPGSSSVRETSLGPAESSDANGELQIIPFRERWWLTPGNAGLSLLVFVDGAPALFSPKVPEMRSRPVTTPRFYRRPLEGPNGELIIACPTMPRCRTAVIVDNFALTFAVALGGLGQSALPGLAILGALALWGGLVWLMARWATFPEQLAGSGLFLVGLAVWLGGDRYASSTSAGLLAGQAVGLACPLALRLAVQQLRRWVPAFVWNDLVLLHDPDTEGRPAWWRATGLGALTALGLAAFLQVLGPPATGRLDPDRHRNWSLDIALGRVLCGAQSRMSSAYPVAARLEADPALRAKPLREVVTIVAGSRDQFCRSLTHPVLNNENSLMLEMALLLRIAPQLSFEGLGWTLQVTRILALLVVAWALLESGASLLLSGIVLASGIVLLDNFDARYYSVYPFLPVLPALVAALLSLALQRALCLRVTAHAAFAVATGWLIAFGTNMRTSHLPLYLAFLALYLAAAYRVTSRRRSPWPFAGKRRWLAAWGLGTAVGYGLFLLLLIRPLSSGAGQSKDVYPDSSRSSSHAIAHPLVLGLAVPENALSQREGIRWEDPVGETLARRIDPRASYLQQGYEDALWTYYRGLWARHPGEMLQVYVSKLQLAGHHLISTVMDSPETLVGGRLLRVVLWPLALLPGGAALLALSASALALCLAAHWRRGSAFAFLMAQFMAAGTLLQLESALILPVFHVSHHGTQLLFLVFLAALLWQLPAEGLRALVRRGRRPTERTD